MKTIKQLREECGNRRVVVVSGPRAWVELEPIRRVVKRFPADVVVVHGAAKGADRLWSFAATEAGLKVVAVPVDSEDWNRLAKRAGMVRNELMLQLKPVACFVCQPFGQSRGSVAMIRMSREAGVPTEVVPLPEPPEPGKDRNCDVLADNNLWEVMPPALRYHTPDDRHFISTPCWNFDKKLGEVVDVTYLGCVVTEDPYNPRPDVDHFGQKHSYKPAPSWREFLGGRATNALRRLPTDQERTELEGPEEVRRERSWDTIIDLWEANGYGKVGWLKAKKRVMRVA